MDINSHIQIPKFLLKNFRSEKGKVLHLLIKENRISSCGADKLGIEKGYFSEEVEAFLNENIEQPFSRIVKKINLLINNERDSIVISPQDKKAVCDFLRSAIARSTKAYNEFLSQSATAIIFEKNNPQSNHDAFVCSFLQHTINSMLSLDNHRLVVLTNSSNVHFAVPRNCFYFVNSCGVACFILPISPKGVIAYVPNDYNGAALGDYLVVSDCKDVEYLNEVALKTELFFNGDFIVSDQKEELERLKLVALSIKANTNEHTLV